MEKSLSIPSISAREIIDTYQVILLDSYGVLMTIQGPLPTARQFIQELNQRDKEYYILTNDASKLQDAVTRRFRDFNIDICPERIITTGSLIKGYFQSHNLQGCRSLVLGPEDSLGYVKEAGGEVISPEMAGKIDPAAVDALIVCDEMGFPFLEVMDQVLSLLFAKFDRSESLVMLLPNPDFIYPKSSQEFGFTSGSMALMLEKALQIRYPGRSDLKFVRLGKPYAPIFAEVVSRCGFSRQQVQKKMVMIGDQVWTDIKGAYDFGIDSAMVQTGLNRAEDFQWISSFKPTYILPNLELD